MRRLTHFHAGFRRRILIPAKRWLTLQHFTAFVMLLYALSLATEPSVTFTALGDALNFHSLPIIFALMFAFSGAKLVGGPVKEPTYRLLLLPLFAYFTVIVWYIASGYTASWSGAIGALAVYGFFNIAGTTLPPEDGDHDAGTR